MPRRNLLILKGINGGPDGTRNRQSNAPAYTGNPNSLISKEAESPLFPRAHPVLRKNGEKVGMATAATPPLFPLCQWGGV